MVKLKYLGSNTNGTVGVSLNGTESYEDHSLTELKNGLDLIEGQNFRNVKIKAAGTTITDINVLKDFKVYEEKLPRYILENEDISIDFYVANIFENESGFQVGETTVNEKLLCEQVFDSEYNLFKDTQYPGTYEGVYAIISLKAPLNMKSFDYGTNFNVCFKNKDSGEIVQEIVCKSLDDLENAKNDWNVIIEYCDNNGHPAEYKAIASIDYEIKSEWSEIFNHETRSAEDYVSNYFSGKDFTDYLLSKITNGIQETYDSEITNRKESDILGDINNKLDEYRSELDDRLDTDGDGNVVYYYAKVKESQFNNQTNSGDLDYEEIYVPIGTTLSEVCGSDTYIVDGSNSKCHSIDGNIVKGGNNNYSVVNSTYIKSSDNFDGDSYISDGIRIIKVVPDSEENESH